ncbi:uncharacterized protein LOC132577871 [Heteronotia binoei]|uniref:uncharacterized protein LOC132577871 n=1 Tax=Heteronotia binoei TaxID=13085 RepID=UPI00293045FD|nr:uncharacterized protein LOC132577871 [Heteronotia binoei]XP_060103616.1 uncharacterized protein LOC132577871 [Heteronotia binoei]XP_060103617.1 uncharacterized protein LOC132577871 [Heteronotia binoei]
MNASPASESGPYSTAQKPFFYAQPTAQQMFPSPCFLGPVYNSYGIPTTGFRNGNPYYPLYSIPVHDYPGYLVPQHPMHMRVNRRPYFNGHLPSPMFYQATRFRHYNPGKRTETKETQTDPKQAESKLKKHQDHSMETQNCAAGSTAYTPSSTSKGGESPLEKQDRAVFSPVSDRDFAKNSSGSVQFRSLPPPGYAYEKEEVRIEYDNDGAPAIQLWKSFKETIPLYDVAEKSVPENVMQRDVFALASCEGVLYGPSDRGELVPSITYPEEQKALEDGQQKGKLAAENQGTASHWTRSPPDETKAAQRAEPTGPDLKGERQETVMSKGSSGLKRPSGPKTHQEVSDQIQQSEQLLFGREKTNDADFPEKPGGNNEMSLESQASLEKSLWCDESATYIPSDSWLARMDTMDPNHNMYASQRKRPSVLSLTSDEMSSVDEGSSVDNIAVSYFAPGYTFQKTGYPFKKSIEGSEREKIKSGGFLNEEEDNEDKVGEEQVGGSEGQNMKNSSRIKIKELSSRSRKLGTLPRSSSRKKLCSLKKKAAKSLSPSEPEDSEEYWVKEPDDEEEEKEEYYLIQGVGPYGTLAPAKYGLYRQDGQQIFWKIPKNAVPAQLISWPVQEKIKISKPANKLKDQEEDEDLCSDYNIYLRKPTAQELEVLEHRRNSQRYSGKLLKEGGGVLADDYWLKSGAKPKFASLLHDGLSPTAKSRELECTLKKKGARKPPHKRRDTRDDAEIEEQWERMKTAHHHKVHGMKRSLYKGRSEL